MALAPVGGSDGAGHGYELVAINRAPRINADGTFTQVVNATALSKLYGVQFTFTMKAATWDTDGGPPLIMERTLWVDQVCGHDHVVGFRTQVDQGPDQVLYNYAVITVGTADELITDEATVRMDHLNDPATFTAIDAVWARLVAAGAS